MILIVIFSITSAFVSVFQLKYTVITLLGCSDENFQYSRNLGNVYQYQHVLQEDHRFPSCNSYKGGNLVLYIHSKFKT